MQWNQHSHWRTCNCDGSPGACLHKLWVFSLCIIKHPFVWEPTALWNEESNQSISNGLEPFNVWLSYRGFHIQGISHSVYLSMNSTTFHTIFLASRTPFKIWYVVMMLWFYWIAHGVYRGTFAAYWCLTLESHLARPSLVWFIATWWYWVSYSLAGIFSQSGLDMAPLLMSDIPGIIKQNTLNLTWLECKW